MSGTSGSERNPIRLVAQWLPSPLYMYEAKSGKMAPTMLRTRIAAPNADALNAPYESVR